MNRVCRNLHTRAVTGLVVAAVVSCTAASRNTVQVRVAPAVSLAQGMYAPYFETWRPDNLANMAQLSGARYFTLAFIQTANVGSCVPTWNGNPKQPVSGSNLGGAINQLRNQGGDVIVSFGGSAADNSGTDIADSCSNVSQIAAAYESVISTYNITRLDMDVEGKSLSDTAGINRRNEALKIAESWAAQHGRSLQVEYTLPTAQSGLKANTLAVLSNAIAEGTKVNIVNIMTFDYLSPHEGTVDMGGTAMNALQDLHGQLSKLYPWATSASLWAMEGVTLLPGIDSAPAKAEVTSLSDASRVLAFGQLNHIGLISIWSIQRDNGGCPGISDSSVCSGLTQNNWAFSKVLSAFAG